MASRIDSPTGWCGEAGCSAENPYEWFAGPKTAVRNVVAPKTSALCKRAGPSRNENIRVDGIRRRGQGRKRDRYLQTPGRRCDDAGAAVVRLGDRAYDREPETESRHRAVQALEGLG